MSIVKITIEDLPNGKIGVRCEPNLATIAKIRLDQELTNAEQTAVMALTEIRNKFKIAESESKGKILKKIFRS